MNKKKIERFLDEHGDWYLTKHISFHFTIRGKNLWEWHVLPFIDISEWRILCGWLCFTAQYTYHPDEFNDD